MTREEAINLIGWLKSKTNRDDDIEAIDMAIEALQAEPTHGRLIDADALKETMKIAVVKHICTNTLYNTIMAVIDGAPTVTVVDITQRDLCEDISCTDCPFMKETCKLMDYVAYADRPLSKG